MFLDLLWSHRSARRKCQASGLDACRLTFRVEAALRQLSEAEEELRKAEAVLAEINNQFQEALASKRELEQRAQATKRRMEQANKLINGLAGEKARW